MKSEDRYFTSAELSEIASRLENYDAVFSQLWQLGKPVFNAGVKTACVGFDEVGQALVMEVNPKFWDSLSPVQKDFIVCHEMLHVILEHGRRAKDAFSLNHDANNRAMDVVVNHMLVNGFGFDRKEIDPQNRLCWIDTVFGKAAKYIAPNQTFEYYLNQMPRLKMSISGIGKKGKGGKSGGQVMDDHSKLPVDEDIQKLAERATEKLSNEEKQQFKERLGQDGDKAKNDGKQRGTTAGSFVKTMDKVRVPRKRKWETLVKRYLKKLEELAMEEKWFQVNRRAATLPHNKIILPAEVESETKTFGRALVYLFLDTSGSCQSLAPRFWALAKTIPRDTFDVRLRCFDTKVYKVNFKEGKLYGFGGTSFDILEKHVQKEMQESKGKYPDAVFMITDGYGNRIVPEKSERWHVLLTPGGDTGEFATGMNIHNLAEFE